jgi:putative phosphoesterase
MRELKNLTCFAAIADTHGKLPEQAVELLKKCEFIIHAGDVCDTQTLEKIQLIAPTLAVRGNNDFFAGLRENEIIQLNGICFHINHYPSEISRIVPSSDWYIFGHTHIPHDETLGRTRHYNPGSVGKANKGAPPSMALFHWRGDSWHPELHILK